MSSFPKYMYLGRDASIFDELPDGYAPVIKKPQEGADQVATHAMLRAIVVIDSALKELKLLREEYL